MIHCAAFVRKEATAASTLLLFEKRKKKEKKRRRKQTSHGSHTYTETGLNRGKCSLWVCGRSIYTALGSVTRSSSASVPLECPLSEGQKV